MKKINRSRSASIAFATIGLCVASFAVPLQNAAAQSGSIAVSSSASLPGVSAAPGGWIVYNGTLTSQLSLTNAKTTTLAGVRNTDGTCAESSSGSATANSAETFGEEVAFNPSTCQEKVTSGTLSAAQTAKLNSLTKAATGSNSASTTSRAGVAAANKTNAVTAAATSYSSAHTKTSWIDPLYITITSLTSNIQWPLNGAGGTISGRWNSYKFAWDGWQETGPPPIHFNNISGGWSLRETDKFTNTDFATFVYLYFGAAGWASCGIHFSVTAHFYHDDTVMGYSNGNRGWAWNDTKDGACSNLVHHGDNTGYGWTA